MHRSNVTDIRGDHCLLAQCIQPVTEPLHVYLNSVVQSFDWTNSQSDAYNRIQFNALAVCYAGGFQSVCLFDKLDWKFYVKSRSISYIRLLFACFLCMGLHPKGSRKDLYSIVWEQCFALNESQTCIYFCKNAFLLLHICDFKYS